MSLGIYNSRFKAKIFPEMVANQYIFAYHDYM